MHQLRIAGSQPLALPYAAGHVHEANRMLTREEQETILRKAEIIKRNFWLRRGKVARGDMSPKRCNDLCEEEREEFADYLKEVG
jgi:hypothetical protein